MEKTEQVEETWENIINYCQSYEPAQRETQLPIMIRFLKEHYCLSTPSIKGGEGMRWVKASEREPFEKGFYTVRGLNNQGNPVDHTDKDKIWFSGKTWIIREGCKVTEWLDESATPKQGEGVQTLDVKIVAAEYAGAFGDLLDSEEKEEIMKAVLYGATLFNLPKDDLDAAVIGFVEWVNKDHTYVGGGMWERDSDNLDMSSTETLLAEYTGSTLSTPKSEGVGEAGEAYANENCKFGDHKQLKDGFIAGAKWAESLPVDKGKAGPLYTGSRAGGRDWEAS